jgi:hypothetical protein
MTIQVKYLFLSYFQESNSRDAMDKNLTLGMQCQDVSGDPIILPHQINPSISGWV